MEFAYVFGLLHHTQYLAQVILLALSSINYFEPFVISFIGAYYLL